MYIQQWIFKVQSMLRFTCKIIICNYNILSLWDIFSPYTEKKFDIKISAIKTLNLIFFRENSIYNNFILYNLCKFQNSI